MSSSFQIPLFAIVGFTPRQPPEIIPQKSYVHNRCQAPALDTSGFVWYDPTMGRPPRIEFEGAVYHILARGNNRRPIFRDQDDRDAFLGIVGGLIPKYDIVVHGYVLMGNHYHLLLETRRPNLSGAMHHLNSSYANIYNRRHGLSGHVLGGRYKSHLIQKDRYLLAVSRYIHLNPVRAGMVQEPEQYAGSSYCEYIGRRAGVGWLTCDWLLEQFADDTKQARRLYRDFVKEGMREAENPWKSLKWGLIIGDDGFVEEIREKFLGGPQLPTTEMHPSFSESISSDDLLTAAARQFDIEERALTEPGRRDNLARLVCIYMF